MESATLTRPTPGLDAARADARRGRARRGSPKIAFALLLRRRSLIGYFVYPTYPNYDSYYSLLWGRELLHVHLPIFEGFRVPDRAPAGDRVGALLSLLRPAAATALMVADHAGLVRGAGRPASTGSGGSAFTPLVGADRGAAAAARRFDFAVPRRARLHRHPVHGAGRVGGGARGAAPAARAAGAAAARRSRACCAPRRGCWPALYCLLDGWQRDLARARRATPRWPRSARWSGRDRLDRHRRPAVLAALTRAASPRSSAAKRRSREVPVGDAGRSSQTLVKLPVLLAAVRRARCSRSG